MFKTFSPQLSSVPSLSFSLTIQPVPPTSPSKSAASAAGGNSLGLERSSSSAALVLCLVSATWDTPTDDAQIASVAKALNAEIVDAAKAQGLFNEWIYLNYAADFQDPIGGYGPEIGAKLRAVSRKYDPGQVFQKNVPGGFKLFP